MAVTTSVFIGATGLTVQVQFIASATKTFTNNGGFGGASLTAIAAALQLIIGDSVLTVAPNSGSLAATQTTLAGDTVTATFDIAGAKYIPANKVVTFYINSATLITDTGGNHNAKTIDLAENDSTRDALYGLGEGFTYYVRHHADSLPDGADSIGTGNQNTGVMDGCGSQAAPFLSLAYALDSGSDVGLTRGDTIKICGRFEENDLTLAIDYGTFTSWDGVGSTGIGTPISWRPQVRGDIVITGSWTSAGGGVYTKNIGAGKKLFGITQNYGYQGGTRLQATDLADGSYYGHLSNQATLGAGLASAGRYNYASGTGLLTVWLQGSADPAACTMSWCIGSAGGGSYTNANGITVTGSHCYVGDFDVVLMMDSQGAGRGIGVKSTGSYNTLNAIHCYDTGWHPVSHQDGTPTGAVISNCISRGTSTSLSGGAGSFVFHAGTGHAAAMSASGFSNYNYCHAPIHADGTTLLHSYTIGGFYSHTSDDDLPAGSVNWDDCHVVYPSSSVYTVSSGLTANFGTIGVCNYGTGFDTANTAVPSDPTDFTLYAVTITDCTETNSASLGFTKPFAMDRCSRIFSRAKDIATAFGTTGNIPAGVTIFARASEFIFDIGNVVAGYGTFFLAANTSKLILRNCTVLEVGTGTTCIWYCYKCNSTSGTYDIQYTVTDRPNCTTANKVYIFPNDGTTSSTTHLLCTGNWWPGSATAIGQQYTTSTDNNSQAEFSANVDPTGIYATPPQFADISVSAAPLATGNLVWRRSSVAPRNFTGINGKPATGNYGAYQYARGPKRTRGRSRNRSSDVKNYVA